MQRTICCPGCWKPSENRICPWCWKAQLKCTDRQKLGLRLHWIQRLVTNCRPFSDVVIFDMTFCDCYALHRYTFMCDQLYFSLHYLSHIHIPTIYVKGYHWANHSTSGFALLPALTCSKLFSGYLSLLSELCRSWAAPVRTRDRQTAGRKLMWEVEKAPL